MMLLHIRYIKNNRPFQDEDKEMLEELWKEHIDVGYDYEYVASIPSNKKDVCENIMKKYNRNYFFSN